MQSVKELITVIVPVYNRQSIVTATLDSISRQSARPRLIIVDNGSTDDTPAVVTKWAKTHSDESFPVEVCVENAKGASAARQKGLALAQTPYVLFFDSDDIMLPDHVDRLCRAIELHPDVDIFGWDIAVTEMDGRSTIYPFFDRDIAFRHIFNSILSTQRYAVRTEFLRKAGGWNPTVLGWNDYELGMRLICASPKVKYLQGRPTVEMKRLADSITGTDYSSGAERWEYAMSLCRDTLLRHGKRRWLGMLDLRYAVLAALYAREKSYENASRLLDSVIRRQSSAWRKALLKSAYRYTALGGRGIHHLLRPLL